jgi:hypothetical protein
MKKNYSSSQFSSNLECTQGNVPGIRSLSLRLHTSQNLSRNQSRNRGQSRSLSRNRGRSQGPGLRPGSSSHSRRQVSILRVIPSSHSFEFALNPQNQNISQEGTTRTSISKIVQLCEDIKNFNCSEYMKIKQLQTKMKNIENKYGTEFYVIYLRCEVIEYHLKFYKGNSLTQLINSSKHLYMVSNLLFDRYYNILTKKEKNILVQKYRLLVSQIENTSGKYSILKFPSIERHEIINNSTAEIITISLYWH